MAEVGAVREVRSVPSWVPGSVIEHVEFLANFLDDYGHQPQYHQETPDDRLKATIIKFGEVVSIQLARRRPS